MKWLRRRWEAAWPYVAVSLIVLILTVGGWGLFLLKEYLRAWAWGLR